MTPEEREALAALVAAQRAYEEARVDLKEKRLRAERADATQEEKDAFSIAQQRFTQASDRALEAGRALRAAREARTATGAAASSRES